MKKQTFAKGALALAVCSIIAKGLGGVYRISLTSVLGAEGIGYYQLVFPFFSLVLALLASGVPVTVSRLVSGELSADNTGGVRTLLQRSLAYALAAGLLGGVMTIALSRLLAGIQSTDGVYICYVAIAPAIVFVTLAGVYKGWFLGNGNMTTVGVSQVAEVTVKLAFGLLAATYFSRYGIMQSVAGALLAVSLGEFVGFLYVFVRYLFASKDFRRVMPTPVDRRFFKSLLPVTLSGLVFPVVAFIDSVSIVNLLEYGGDVRAVTHYGLLTGPVNSLINMPIVFAMSVAVAIVPALAGSLANYEVVSIKRRTATSVKVCFIIAFPFFAGCAFLAPKIVSLLYPALSSSDKSLTATLMAISAIDILLLSLLEVFNAVLTGLGRSKPVLVNVATAGSIKILLQVLFAPRFGIVACAFATIAFYSVAMFANAYVYNNLVGKNTILAKSIAKVLFAGVIMCVTVFACSFISNPLIAVIAGALAGGAVYIAAIIFLRTLDSDELRLLPFCKKLAARVDRGIHGKEKNTI